MRDVLRTFLPMAMEPNPPPRQSLPVLDPRAPVLLDPSRGRSVLHRICSPTGPEILPPSHMPGRRVYVSADPALPPPAYTTFEPKGEVSAFEAVLTRIDEHREIARTADRLGYPQPLLHQRRWRPLIVALLAVNLFIMLLIIVAVYMGVVSRSPLWKNAFWCKFTNSLPKSLVSGAFVFTVAVVGMTPFAQSSLKGVWTMLLYSFFVFMIGSVIGAATHGLDLTVVVCGA